MKPNVNFLAPLGIFIYFAIALYPIVTYTGTEIFPFFSFKLYSKIPNGFVQYDILLNHGEEDPEFLLFRNSELNKLEVKYLYKSINDIGLEFESTGVINRQQLARFAGGKAAFVKLQGDYIETIRSDQYNIEIICFLE